MLSLSTRENLILAGLALAGSLIVAMQWLSPFFAN